MCESQAEIHSFQYPPTVSWQSLYAEPRHKKVELDFMIRFKFKQLISECLPFGRVLLSFANWDQLQIKEQSE